MFFWQKSAERRRRGVTHIYVEGGTGSLGSKKSGRPSQLARGHFSVLGSRLRFFSICSFHRGRVAPLRASCARQCSFACSYNIYICYMAVGNGCREKTALAAQVLHYGKVARRRRVAGSPPIAHNEECGSKRRNLAASLRGHSDSRLTLRRLPEGCPCPCCAHTSD